MLGREEAIGEESRGSGRSDEHCRESDSRASAQGTAPAEAVVLSLEPGAIAV